MRSARYRLFLTFGLFVGCGGGAAVERPPDVWALVRWQDAPASAADIGYEVNVEVGSRNRRGACTAPPPPDLRVTVNDREATSLGSDGNCDWNVVFRVRGFEASGSATVRVLDDMGDVGEARFDGLFPGAAAVLVMPSDGRVPAGGDVVVAIPAGLTLPASPQAEFYWRDSPAGGPALFTPAPAQLAPDGLSVTTQVPNLPGVFGRAALIFDLGGFTSRGSDGCTGLSSCTSTVAGVLGPLELEVLPPQP